MNMYIQSPRHHYRKFTVHFEFTFSNYCLERLHKLYKGNLHTMIPALYRDRLKKETKIHRWFLECYLSSENNFAFERINITLHDLLLEYLDIDTEVLYHEYNENKAFLDGPIETWNLDNMGHQIQMMGRDMKRLSGISEKIENNESYDTILGYLNQENLNEHEKDVILTQLFFFENDEMMISFINNLTERQRHHFLTFIGNYFADPSNALSLFSPYVKRIIWYYDVPISWQWGHLRQWIEDSKLRKPSEDNPFSMGGILLEYWMLQYPERFDLVEHLLDGVVAKPSEILQYFKTGYLPHNGDMSPLETELIL